MTTTNTKFRLTYKSQIEGVSSQDLTMTIPELKADWRFNDSRYPAHDVLKAAEWLEGEYAAVSTALKIGWTVEKLG